MDNARELIIDYLRRRALASRGTAFSCTPTEVAREVFRVARPTPRHLAQVSNVLNTLACNNIAMVWERAHRRRRFVVDKRKLLSLDSCSSYYSYHVSGTT